MIYIKTCLTMIIIDLQHLYSIIIVKFCLNWKLYSYWDFIFCIWFENLPFTSINFLFSLTPLMPTYFAYHTAAPGSIPSTTSTLRFWIVVWKGRKEKNSLGLRILCRWNLSHSCQAPGGRSIATAPAHHHRILSDLSSHQINRLTSS